MVDILLLHSCYQCNRFHHFLEKVDHTIEHVFCIFVHHMLGSMMSNWFECPIYHVLKRDNFREQLEIYKSFMVKLRTFPFYLIYKTADKNISLTTEFTLEMIYGSTNILHLK